MVVISALVSTQSRAAAPAQSSEITRSFDFRDGALGWLPDFVGYTQFNQDTYELVAERRPLPTELGINGTGFFFQGHNRCDCLGMFLKRRLSTADGVVAGQRYRLNYTVRLASNAQSGCIGAGGAPGESVRLYFGGAQIEPTTFAEDDRGLKFQLPVDSVHRVPDFDWLTQIVVRLPNELIGASNVRVSFNLRGASSNQAAINLISN